MGRNRQKNGPVAAGLVVSVAIHLAMLLPALVMVMGASTIRPGVRANFAPEHYRPRHEEEEEQPPEEDQTQLGLENGSSSSMTWVGYEQYQEHLAALGETEQAAFAESPGDQATEEQPSPAAQAPPGAENPRETQESPEQLAQKPPVDAAIEKPVEDQQPTPEPTNENNQPPAEKQPSQPELLRNTDPDAPMLPTQAPIEPVVEQTKTPEKMEAEKPVPQEQVQPTEAPVPPQETSQKTESSTPPPTKPTEPKPASEPGRQTPGDVSDRESDASSVTEVPIDKLKLGKPIAAKGLEVKPRRPEFSALLRMTASPGNPLVELKFDKDGKPAKGTKVLESSGDQRIDQALESSLFRWRAKGKQLAALKEGETIDVRIRIVLGRRRR